MTIENTTREKSTRTPRANQTRAGQARREPWKPPSVLDAPPPPEGYKHRWIRSEVMGFDDRKNVAARSREGWELVRGEEYPDFEIPTVDDGKHAGVIGVGGLILAKIPKETVDERRAYYQNVADQQIQAVDNDLMRESNQVMPISAPSRTSKVTFGKGGS